VTQLLDKKQIALKLGVSTRTVDRLIAEAELPHYKIGGQYRFDPDAVGEWLQTRGNSGKPDIL